MRLSRLLRLLRSLPPSFGTFTGPKAILLKKAWAQRVAHPGDQAVASGDASIMSSICAFVEVFEVYLAVNCKFVRAQL